MRLLTLALTCLLWVSPAWGQTPAPTQPAAPAVPAVEAEPDLLPRWSDAQVAELIAAARTAPAHGMATDPGVEALQIQRGVVAALPAGSIQRLAEAARMDFMAAELFRRVALDFGAGRVSPRQVDRNWQIPPPAPDTDALMRAAVQGGTWAIGRTLDSLLPTHPDYRALEAALVRALAATPPDDPLALAARERRLTAIRADLERWRWLPREVPGRRIEVRIPFQRLDFHLGDGRVERFTAIVGAPRTTTNSLVDVARSVVFNPTWIAPRRIALDELLPSLRSDPAAMEAQGFELVAADGTAVPPTAVDPASLTRSGFAWSVRQRAGERNALGRVKFPLTNRWAIFLHDTANRQLFGREMRALSHGCVRVQDPLRLARLMLADTGGWTDARIAEATVPGGAERGVRVASPVPVWLVYLVTEPDAAGGLSVAPDIYGLDTALVKALDQPRAPEAAFGIRLNTRVAMP